MDSSGSHRARATTAAHAITGRFLTAVDEYVHANHDVAFYADALRIHPDYLTRCVKASRGVTPKTIIQRELAARAQKLLRAGLSVGETATTLGFDNAAYFSRFYKRVHGIRPSDEPAD